MMRAMIPKPDNSFRYAGRLPLSALTELDKPDLCRVDFLHLKLLKSSSRNSQPKRQQVVEILMTALHQGIVFVVSAHIAQP